MIARSAETCDHRLQAIRHISGLFEANSNASDLLDVVQELATYPPQLERNEIKTSTTYLAGTEGQQRRLRRRPMKVLDPPLFIALSPIATAVKVMREFIATKISC